MGRVGWGPARSSRAPSHRRAQSSPIWERQNPSRKPPFLRHSPASPPAPLRSQSAATAAQQVDTHLSRCSRAHSAGFLGCGTKPPARQKQTASPAQGGHLPAQGPSPAGRCLYHMGRGDPQGDPHSTVSGRGSSEPHNHVAVSPESQGSSDPMWLEPGRVACLGVGVEFPLPTGSLRVLKAHQEVRGCCIP